MLEFSLIVATKGRTHELVRLIQSIGEQPYIDYELIIVDQNEDDRVADIIASSKNRARISHLRCDPGVSKARNVGLDNVRGAIIGFPDDDCWYPQGLLTDVSSWFRANPAYDVLSVNSLDDNGTRSCNRWFQDSCNLNRLNVYRASAGYTYFVRLTPFTNAVRYDEQIGPGAGTTYLGGEDTDYVLALMEAGSRGRFEAKWFVGHPLKDIRNAGISRDRAYTYGRGMGFVQRKHRLAWLFALQCSFDYGRAFIAWLIGRRQPAKLWFWHGRGVVDGFLQKSSNHQF